ncbi:hypothetical protein FYJ43_09085 [Cutibacterium sp. WCA-380-WT-3A]|uniref:RoxP n=1 Tax=Cutibacterium porci TaxID=2605781 RepID=A0A7K0J8B4_9ACTN|nr:hypothetical protein [Cutibacterium porci]MSS46180.1 hypothetical protein [Cutibacterium porci]
MLIQIAASIAAASAMTFGIPGTVTPINTNHLSPEPQVSVTDISQHTGPFAVTTPLTVKVTPSAPCVSSDGHQESIVARILDDQGHQVWAGTFDESTLIGGTGRGTATFHVGSAAATFNYHGSQRTTYRTLGYCAYPHYVDGNRERLSKVGVAPFTVDPAKN